MTLESLNIWGGRMTEALLDHIATQSDSIDIFCFQEVFHHGATQLERQLVSDMEIFEKIQALLPHHVGFFDKANDTPVHQEGIAIFIRSTLPVISQGDLVVFRERNSLVGHDPRTLPRNIQYVQTMLGKIPITVVNFHGLWDEFKKSDSPARLEQSRQIRSFLDTVEGEKILCGDFNLKPDTQSMALLESDMHNLIKDYAITSTRTSLYSGLEQFADYILVSQGIRVVDFRVLDSVVSDHAPLYLKCT